MWALLYSDGALTHADIRQVVDEQWLPVAALRDRSAPDAPGRVLLFYDRDVAYKFARRNLKDKDWLKGAIDLPAADVAWVAGKFPTEVLTFPQLYTAHPQYELGYEVIDLHAPPDVTYKEVRL